MEANTITLRLSHPSAGGFASTESTKRGAKTNDAMEGAKRLKFDGDCQAGARGSGTASGAG